MNRGERVITGQECRLSNGSQRRSADRRMLLVGFCAIMLAACMNAPGMAVATSDLDPRQNMTSQDRHIASMAMQIAMERRPDNYPSTWTNGLSGNYGAVMPLQTYWSQAGEYCRSFAETMTVSGVTATFERTACRSGDGLWLAQS